VTITFPSSGATLNRGSQTITANASDNVGVTVVKTYLNGSIVCQDTTAPYRCPVSLTPGGATIDVTALDARGNSRTHEVNVTVR
jgi:leucyl aminopeptidase